MVSLLKPGQYHTLDHSVFAWIKRYASLSLHMAQGVTTSTLVSFVVPDGTLQTLIMHFLVFPIYRSKILMSYGTAPTFFAAFARNFDISIPSYMLLFGFFYLRTGIAEYLTQKIYKRLSPYLLKERSLEYGKTCLGILSYEIVEWLLTPLDFYLMYSNLNGLDRFMGFVKSKGFLDLPKENLVIGYPSTLAINCNLYVYQLGKQKIC
ncbi:hypothetical protein HDV04_000555 [Boothiomyces sp. JEL0838]|nr:hypothetical protein HDV04_000555 [Boothiomyces sp. JEL0838]